MTRIRILKTPVAVMSVAVVVVVADLEEAEEVVEEFLNLPMLVLPVEAVEAIKGSDHPRATSLQVPRIQEEDCTEVEEGSTTVRTRTNTMD